jgi:hypothetical protein
MISRKFGDRTAEVVPLTFGRARINLYAPDGMFVDDCW